VIVADACAATVLVATVKVAVVAPAATVTVEGTVADVELLCRVTARPPVGAGPVNVTVPVLLVPPATDVGLRLTELTAGGLIVRDAEAEELPELALIVAVVTLDTAMVVTANVAVVAPAATVTLAGTVADVELLCRLTD